jgi:hypothetical protein
MAGEFVEQERNNEAKYQTMFECLWHKTSTPNGQMITRKRHQDQAHGDQKEHIEQNMKQETACIIPGADKYCSYAKNR